MTVLAQRFAIVNGNYTKYAYLDMGDVKYDEKMPRRSGVANTMPDAERLVDRFYAALDHEITFAAQRIMLYSGTGKNPDAATRTQWENTLANLKARQFHIVKISVDKV